MTRYKRLVQEWNGWRIAEYEDNRQVSVLSIVYPRRESARTTYDNIRLPEHPNGDLESSGLNGLLSFLASFR